MQNYVLANVAENGNRFERTGTSFVSRFLRKVFASEGSDAQQDTSDDALNFEDLVTRARTEEKNKLYPIIEALKKEKKVLVKANNEHLLAIARLEEQVKTLTEQLTLAGSQDPQVVVGLKKQLEDALKLVDDLRDELKTKPEETAEELRQKIETELNALYEVKTYRLQKIEEVKDSLLVPEMVVGDTKEAVDKSLADALEHSEKIRKKLGVGASDEEADDTTAPKGPKPNPANPVGKGNNMGEIDAATIRNMNDEEYAQWRKNAGFK